jgi:hypothetical protein
MHIRAGNLVVATASALVMLSTDVQAAMRPIPGGSSMSSIQLAQSIPRNAWCPKGTRIQRANNRRGYRCRPA